MNETTFSNLSQALLLTREISMPANDAALRAIQWDDISNTAIVVLCTLAARGDVRPRELIGQTKLTSGGLSNLLGRLERRGLLQRSDDPGSTGDQRAVMISLTQRGREFESCLCDAIFRGLRDAEGRVKDLVVVLVETGAVPREIGLPAGLATPERVTLAMSMLGIELAEGLRATNDIEPADTNAALVLASLGAQGECRPRRIAHLLGISSGGVSRLLDRLEDAGLVERSSNEDDSDNRGVTVKLTPSGRSHLETLLVGLSEHLDCLLTILRLVIQDSHAPDA